MKSVNELGISPMPWELMDDGATVVTKQAEGVYGEVCYCRESCDARLIAAAPELYECLREATLIEQCHDAETHCEFCPTLSQCRAYRWKKILAKAAEKEANND